MRKRKFKHGSKNFSGLPGGLCPGIYNNDNYVVLDFETLVNDGLFGSSVDKRNGLAMGAWVGSTGPVRSDWFDEYRLPSTDLARRIADADFIVAHNAKYELGWLARSGIDTSRLLVFDTKIAEYVLLGNLATGDPDNGVGRVSTSLDDCCIRRGYSPKDPIVDMWMKNGIRVDLMPAKWVEDRCKQDVDTTRKLFLDQRKRLSDSNRLGVLYTRCLLTPVLAAIETEGMHLDAQRVSATHAEYSEQLAGLEREFHEVSGGINWRSPPQVAAFLYDTLGFPEPRGRDGQPKRTPSGRRMASKKSIAGLRPSSDAQRRFISLRSAIGKVGFALSKSLDYFKEVCDTRNCIFNAEFNQTVTATHRLSSSGIRSESGKSVQFQNLPRDFKRLFSARRDGWLMGEADGAQLEFRVAAFLGDDAQARKEIAEGWDTHCITAAAMLEKTYEEVYAAYKAGEKWAVTARQEAKAETFKPLYGGSKGTKAQERWYDEFKRRYKDLAAKQKDWVYEVLRTKRLVTPWGLRYYWPHAKMSDSGYCNVGSAVYNYPVQALATAEIIPVAVTYLWHRIKAEGLERDIVLVNTVHDSIVAEINPEHADDFRRLARLAFGPDVHDYLLRVYGMDFDVPLGTGLKIGTHWGEGPEEKYEYLR